MAKGWGEVAGVAAALLCAVAWARGQEQPLLVVGSDTTTAGEFLYSYSKNHEVRISSDTLTLRDFLDSYIVYRLKVMDARRLKLDTFRKYRSEFTRYRDAQLAQSLLSGEEVEASYRAAYERLRREVDASHILVSVANGRDDSAALRKAFKLRAELLAGADFDSLARRESDDASAQHNGGHLGYFSAFTMIAPFEAAAFSTAAGMISEPVRSRFGYHLIKVHDVRPSRGRMRIAHVMVRFPNSASEAQRDSARAAIGKAYDEARAGVPFDTLMKRYSPFIYSAGVGGRYPWVRTGSVPGWFGDQVFSLRADGDVSAPFESALGWHLVKRIEYEAVPSYDAARERLRVLMRQSGESVDDEAAFVRAARRKVGAHERDSVAFLLARWVLRADAETMPPGLDSMQLGVVDGVPLRLSDFLAWTRAEGISIAGMQHEALSRVITRYVDVEAVERVAERVAAENKQFGYLIREFRDGLLLFDVSEQKVWAASLATEEALRAYYDKHAAELFFDTCYVVEVYSGQREASLAKVAQMFREGRKRRLSKRSMRSEGIECREMRLGGEHPLMSGYGEVQPAPLGQSVREVPWRGECFGPVERRGEYRFYRVVERLAHVPMRYEESKPLIRERLQAERERTWVAELRSELRVEVNDAALRWVENQLESAKR